MPRSFQVLNQRGGGLVGFFAALRQICRQLAVMVPVAMEELDEAHAALRQPPRQQAIRREGARASCILSVKVERCVARLFGKIGQLRHRRLHAKRHLILRDARRDFRIADTSSKFAWLSLPSASRKPRRSSVAKPGGFEGTAPGRRPNGISRPDSGSAENRFPTGDRRAAGRRRLCPGEIITTKAGRSSVSHPMP